MQYEIRDAFIEFQKYPCPYRDCMHIKEEDCAIKRAVIDGKIPKYRYDNYLNLVKTGKKEEYKRRWSNEDICIILSSKEKVYWKSY